MDKKTKYDSDSIETLRFPENVRSNPSMYLGSIDAAGVWLCSRELLDNGLDEHLAGRNNAVMLHVDKDGSYWVLDNGEGIPQGIKTYTTHINGKEVRHSIPTMQAVFGELHTSGKYRTEAYKVSVGTHGIGAKGTNATAEFFEVFTCYKNKWYTIAFKKGKLTQSVTECKPPKSPTGNRLKQGTLIHFKPDSKIFTTKSFPSSMAIEWAEIMSYLNPGFKIVISSSKGKREFYSKKGPSEYVSNRLARLKTEGERQMFEYHSDLADIVIAFSNYDGCDVRGFTNGLSNSQGGKHVDSLCGAIYNGLKPFIKNKKISGKLVPLFRENDLKEGLVGLINAKLHKAQFSSQDKARLTDDRVGKEFEQQLAKIAEKFFKENKALANRLCDRAIKLNELKTKFTLSKKAAASLNAVKRLGLPAKYASCDPRTKVQDREVLIVEGDSAAGSVKEARLAYQSVMPLKGKILNSLKDSKNRTLESEEIINILAAIGYDVKAADPYKKLTVGKIICLADPDPDGPFIGETLIRIKVNEEEKLEQINILAKAKFSFQVPVFIGNRETWTDATASLVTNVNRLVALQIGSTKYKVSENHKFQSIKTRATYGRGVQADDHNLIWLEAKDMKIGDRVYCPNYNGHKDPAHNDKETKLGFEPVSKLRIQELSEPVPVYCLTVPKYHKFLLPSGIVSANCHINSLLLALFYKYLPELFERGMIYVSAAPEFYAIHKNQLITGDTLSIVQKKLAKIGASNTTIHHLKGWGEASANLMKLFAIDPSTRRLIKIKAIEADDRIEFVKCMDEDVQFRREMLGLPSNIDVKDTKIKPKKKLKEIKSY